MTADKTVTPLSPDDRERERPRPDQQHRRFVLERDVDETGVSGTGTVAEGVLWTNSTATVQWRGEFASNVYWPGGLRDVLIIHGHDGMTRVVFLDPE
ncbi:MAG: hypothetical protein ACT4NY_09040 [Pseudonocardiales bacterium]